MSLSLSFSCSVLLFLLSSASVAKKKRRRNLTGLVFLKHCDSCSFLNSLFITLFWEKREKQQFKNDENRRKKKNTVTTCIFLTAAFRHPAILITQCDYAVRKKEKKRVTNVFKCHLAVENVFHGDFSLCVLTICSIY